MQLVEQQRAIEGQKKKMETVFTQQRLELGKAAFLNVIKKGGGKKFKFVNLFICGLCRRKLPQPEQFVLSCVGQNIDYSYGSC
uniref:Uncharacterized protein n=1 Tax=Gadus morhua TaxID=8049 RepID=A0A8C5CC15_GADMO